MPHDKQTKLSHFFLYLLTLIFTLMHIPTHAHLTTLAKNDAIPMFTTLNIDEEFLLTKEQLEYKCCSPEGRNYQWADKKRDRFAFSLSPFAQNADRGKTIKGSVCPPVTVPCPEIQNTALGDLTGRTGMIALLYGPAPIGQELPDILLEALDHLFPDGVESGLDNEDNIDPEQYYGFFSFPLKYRKRGVRFELAARISNNFGILLQAGMSTIRQVREDTIDTTGQNDFEPAGPDVADNLDEFLMDQFEDIAIAIDIDTCDFIKTSMEEVRFNIFWRQAFAMNEDSDRSWARFLLIPYVEAGVSAAPGKRENDFKFFAAPFGNNGHTAVGFTTGINIDFLETIEIGGEIGYTHFFKRTYCRPIPNNEFQTNLYPFSTEVTVHPGDNWYFGARLAAYHFIDHLSMYFEWFVLDHQQDSICLTEPDDAFLPDVLECTTSFKTKLGNAGFNYDLSPNVGLGFLWQIPFSQRNSYRSSTIMVGLNVTF